MKGKLALLLLSLTFILGCSPEPNKLSGKKQTITVNHVDLKCACPNFIETKDNRHDKMAPSQEDCFYVEAANEIVEIPEKYYNNPSKKYTFKLQGEFYEKKFVPESYKEKTESEYMEARVFKYFSYELVTN